MTTAAAKAWNESLFISIILLQSKQFREGELPSRFDISEEEKLLFFSIYFLFFVLSPCLAPTLDRFKLNAPFLAL